MKTAEELLLDLEETEKQMSELNKKVNQLSKQKEEIISNINSQGYVIEGGKLIASKLVHAIEWNIDYNNYYVGEYGMHTISTSGMTEISEEQYATILQMIETSNQELGEYLNESVLYFEDGIVVNTMKHATCNHEGDVIHFIWEEEGYNDDTMNVNSFLKIHKEMSMVQIKNSEFEYDAIAP